MQKLDKTVDINCDLGEGFGAYPFGCDAELMKWISSANIACGFHAGDAAVMRKTVALCLEHGVSIGAHPGLPDLNGFGRREMHMTPQEAYEITVYQLGALLGFTCSEGAVLSHVKLHGAFYHMTARDARLAEAVVEAVDRVDGRLAIYGLAGSELLLAAQRKGLTTIPEAFLDRGYAADGTLLARGKPGAVVEDVKQAAEQAVRIVLQGKVQAVTGESVSIMARTLCIHGDNPHAASFARTIRMRLEEQGIAVQAAAFSRKC